MTDGDRAPRPRRRRARTSTAPSASATGGSRSSTSRRAARSRWPTDDGDFVDHLQRRDLQLPRAARASSSSSGTASARAPTPRSCCARYERVGRRAASSASTACSRSRSGTGARGELFLARDRYGIKPLYVTRRRRRVPVRSEIKALPRAPGVPREVEPAAPARVLHVPEHLHRRHALRRRAAAAAGPHADDLGARRLAPRARRYWDFDFAEHDDGSVATRSTREELDRLFARPSSGSSSATCRSART